MYSNQQQTTKCSASSHDDSRTPTTCASLGSRLSYPLFNQIKLIFLSNLSWPLSPVDWVSLWPTDQYFLNNCTGIESGAYFVPILIRFKNWFSFAGGLLNGATYIFTVDCALEFALVFICHLINDSRPETGQQKLDDVQEWQRKFRLVRKKFQTNSNIFDLIPIGIKRNPT